MRNKPLSRILYDLGIIAYELSHVTDIIALHAREKIEAVRKELDKLIEDDRVDGWSNRETWAVNLTIANEPTVAPIRSAMVRMYFDRCLCIHCGADGEVNSLAEHLEKWICGLLSRAWDGDTFGADEGKFADELARQIGRTSLGRVQWREIADHWLTQAALEKEAG